MVSSEASIQELMEQGSKALTSGDTPGALQRFLQAKEAMGISLTAEVEQLIGICHRMLGMYTKAEEAFEEACRRAKTDTHTGRIKRDWGMVPLECGLYDKALALFMSSLHLLMQDGEAPVDPEQRVEYFVTIGFIGRAHSTQRTRENHQLAQKQLRTADRELRGHAPYELNNLVWRLKVEPFRKRIRLVRRALRLAREARNRPRMIQITLLLACRPLGMRIRK